MLSTNPVTVGVPREHAPDETRVALVPAGCPPASGGVACRWSRPVPGRRRFPDAAYRRPVPIGRRPETLGAVTSWGGRDAAAALSDHPSLVVGLLDDRYTGGWSDRHRRVWTST